jgi:Tol biopolymer transport system component
LIEGNGSGLSLGRHLVYSLNATDTNIWRAELRPPGLPLAAPQRLIASTRKDAWARYSPDGTKIAFGSTRTGPWEIWIAQGDGTNPVQLTFLGGPASGIKDWSPDGRRLVFHDRGEGHGDLFTIAATGGVPQRLTTHPADDLTPSYSHDGRWIYFGSMRSGRPEIWKLPAEGGEAIQITHSEGSYLPLESPDGETLYYCDKLPEKGIWKMPVKGGPGVQVTGPYAPPLCGMAVTADGLYYTTVSESGKQHSIEFLSFSTGKSRPVVISDRLISGLPLSVSPDQRFIIYTQTDQSGSDLMLIENFAPR